MKRASKSCKAEAVGRSLDPVVLHPYQAKIIAAMLSDKPLTIFLGRKCGVTYAERIAKQIKAEMDKMQNPGADRTRHLVTGTVEPFVGQSELTKQGQ